MDLLYSDFIKKRVPEANIQAEFYRLCRANDIRVLLEVKYENCRFDALIFKDDRPFAIIEVKNYSHRKSTIGLTTKGRQMKKYMKYGLPIIGVLSSKHIHASFERLLLLIQKSDSCLTLTTA